MIAVDTNVLVHAHRSDAPKHAAAKRRLVALAEGKIRWGIPLFCIGSSRASSLTPRVWDHPHTPAEAWAALDALIASPSARVLLPGGDFVGLLSHVMQQSGVSANGVFDAMIVAVCREKRRQRHPQRRSRHAPLRRHHRPADVRCVAHFCACRIRRDKISGRQTSIRRGADVDSKDRYRRVRSREPSYPCRCRGHRSTSASSNSFVT